MNWHNIPGSDVRGECCIPCAEDNLEVKFFETLTANPYPLSH